MSRITPLQRVITRQTSVLIRTYAGLAYNPQPEHQTHKVGQVIDPPKTESVETTSGITKVISDIDAAPKQPSDPEATFDLINSGAGSVILVQLPSKAKVMTSPGIVLGHSENVTFRRVLHGNLSAALMGKLFGDTLFMDQFYASPYGNGDLLIAPPRLGDLAIVTLDGRAELCARRGAVMAYSGKIKTKLTTRGFGLRVDRHINRHVTGRGQLVLNAYGGLYRMSLAPGEVYYIEPKRVVAWDVALRPSATHPVADTHIPELLRTRYSLINEVTATILATIRRGWRQLLGNERLYRIQGPGDIYLASRLEPRFPTLRALIGYPDPYRRTVGSAPSEAEEEEARRAATIVAAHGHLTGPTTVTPPLKTESAPPKPVTVTVDDTTKRDDQPTSVKEEPSKTDKEKDSIQTTDKAAPVDAKEVKTTTPTSQSWWEKLKLTLPGRKKSTPDSTVASTEIGKRE